MCSPTARYIVGQPPIAPETLESLKALRCVFNVETNLLNNMPYETLFQRGIHVVTTGLVFAEPVAELGLAMALNLARDIVDADLAFRQGKELWGGDGNQKARLLSGADVGIIGFGDLGACAESPAVRLPHQDKSLRPLAAAIDPHRQWRRAGLARRCAVQSDFVFVVASVTSENQGFLGADAFAKMRKELPSSCSAAPASSIFRR